MKKKKSRRSDQICQKGDLLPKAGNLVGKRLVFRLHGKAKIHVAKNIPFPTNLEYYQNARNTHWSYQREKLILEWTDVHTYLGRTCMYAQRLGPLYVPHVNKHNPYAVTPYLNGCWPSSLNRPTD